MIKKMPCARARSHKLDKVVLKKKAKNCDFVVQIPRPRSFYMRAHDTTFASAAASSSVTRQQKKETNNHVLEFAKKKIANTNLHTHTYYI